MSGSVFLFSIVLENWVPFLSQGLDAFHQIICRVSNGLTLGFVRHGLLEKVFRNSHLVRVQKKTTSDDALPPRTWVGLETCAMSSPYYERRWARPRRFLEQYPWHLSRDRPRSGLPCPNQRLLEHQSIVQSRASRKLKKVPPFEAENE